MKAMRTAALAAAASGLLLAAPGCVTLTDNSEQVAENADRRMLNEKVLQLEERVASLAAEQETLRRNVDQARQMAGGQGEAGRLREQTLVQRIQALEAARESDRQYIVDQLSRRLSTISAQQAAPAPSRQSGYEHVVQAGETLSEIAKAYKVRTDAIMKANNISNPGLIRVGQKLFIPD